MAASNAIKAIGIQWNKKIIIIKKKEYNKKTTKTKLQRKERFLPPSFDRFIFICSDIITLNKVTCRARILQVN